MPFNRVILKLGKHINSGLVSGCHSGYCKQLCTIVGNEEKFGKLNYPMFKPNRVVILSRITRYEFEKLMYKDATEEQFKQTLKRKRSDYRNMLERHKKHYNCLEKMTNLLRSKGIETKVVKRPQFTSEVLDWADAVITAGGDGTFLDAASKILNIDTPIIGVNTDPTRSEGRLCLPKEEYSALNFDRVLERLLSGDFKWKWRQRIRITMSGYHAYDEPIELSNQQLQNLEHRYTEHVQENEMFSRPLSEKGVKKERVLPVRALNEVFFGECLSSRVSYYELSIDNMPGVKQKSSGVTVCTGTGSTSWHCSINELTPEAVRDILNIANKECSASLPTYDNHFVEAVTQKFNDSIVFDPSELSMGYSVRDPIKNGVFQVPSPRGMAKRIRIASRMWDACLVVDGGCSFRFNDGAIATLEILSEDALRTVEFD
ncbi:NAD kinase 2, mitochondrial-like isoform X2 [Dreissena polymorpha]|uniref:NAD kinase 2, mitochondrial n=1 Tax=Dreissena polymorpha TaxID=45954 RepID=A0A9D3YCL3_DREPO|nr:NAD kinase 2, mitochondrial-like isoform X2 [Dreissena polymorpha]XP_052256085.1 NAD kinase 2, mitochondrial-like isoform X2 [Dreissena polymorpha]XP_052256086.1 NAD kinase 2, mitochondrial-like isoform X2 [Dreissena polymorpha]XP_052256087.1 NAD kinase 2, mitochondrial-like isoform X2 [Dreissena polymorpha]XP_052256090.1 NAD kinase 2, mitochondrial-like isoform X2 [Dreissena polymorpha]XP_052256091.1 NAD kinase 2, mitochondrial-like isoform X2 [Dreissena polymorpha]XP_052256092.1 NAD kina